MKIIFFIILMIVAFLFGVAKSEEFKKEFQWFLNHSDYNSSKKKPHILLKHL